MGCKKPETYCGVEDPINDLDWLKETVENPNPAKMQVYKQTYNSIEGFYVYICIDSGCNSRSSYYKTCNDTVLYYSSSGFTGSNFPNDFNTNSSYKELIYNR